MAPRFSLARRKAKSLLRTANVKSAPVPVEKIAEILGATIQFEPLSNDVSGMYFRQDDGSSIIGVNSAQALVRQRFTIAHEIGHLVLHDEQLHVDESYPVRFRNSESSKATSAVEMESNRFAAELLMPLRMLRVEIDRLPDELSFEEAIRHLAQRFQVSEQAMSIRLSALNVIS